MTVACLITVHNRRSTTINCLQALFSNTPLKDVSVDVYLVDDGSSDGTADAIINQFPSVNIIEGTGYLFWNQGMRLAWKTAHEYNDYDFYLWLNDDTVLDSSAMSELFQSYYKGKKIYNKEVLVCGACRNNDHSEEFSYGIRDDFGPIIPKNYVQEGKYMNGNIVLIPNEIFKVLGFLSNAYTHYHGDYDYGLRSIEKGFRIITTKKYIATCPINEGVPDWCNPNISLSKRWNTFHSPLGLNIKEYIKYRQKFWPNTYWVYILTAYLKCFSPRLYKVFSVLRPYFLDRKPGLV